MKQASSVGPHSLKPSLFKLTYFCDPISLTQQELQKGTCNLHGILFKLSQIDKSDTVDLYYT